MLAVLDNIVKAAQIAAILIAGAWVYFKTIRGRTFIPRLQPKVSAKVIQHRGAQYLLVDMQVQNVGASMARIKQDGTALEISAVRRFAAREPQEMFGLYTKRSIHLGLFDLDKKKPESVEEDESTMVIEPGTIIFSQEIIEVPVDQYDAFRVELRVSAPEGFFSRLRMSGTEGFFARKERKWSAWAIALLEPYNEVTEQKRGAVDDNGYLREHH